MQVEGTCERCGRKCFVWTPAAMVHPCCLLEDAGPDRGCKACNTSDGLNEIEKIMRRKRLASERKKAKEERWQLT